MEKKKKENPKDHTHTHKLDRTNKQNQKEELWKPFYDDIKNN